MKAFAAQTTSTMPSSFDEIKAVGAILSVLEAEDLTDRFDFLYVPDVVDACQSLQASPLRVSVSPLAEACPPGSEAAAAEIVSGLARKRRRSLVVNSRLTRGKH